MNTAPLSKSVRSIVVLTLDSSGVTVPVMIYEKPGLKKKKGSRILRPFETATRQLADASERYAQSYADRHRNSNRKKRDGWLRDLSVNMARAANKGSKRLKITRMMLP
jgi:Family of unknown function (DUF6312)